MNCILFFILYKFINTSLCFNQNDHQNFAQMEHHAQSVDDALIGGLSYKLKAGASYVTDRRAVTFFASGGNQYSSSGAKVCKFNIVADQWLDPSTSRVMFTLHNQGGGANNTQPLHWNPAVMFRRARIIAGGQVIEDIDDFNRLSLMMAALKPQDGQKEIAMEGFGLFDIQYDAVAMVNGGGFNPDSVDAGDNREIYRNRDWDEAGPIFEFRPVLFKPMLRIIAQEKLTPLRYCPLQIELGLVSSASECMFVGIQNGLTSVDQWGISDIQCKMDLLTLDSSPQNEYASHLLSGKPLPINFSSFNHTNQATNGDKDFSAHIHRALARLKSVFITLYRDGATAVMNPGTRKAYNDFYHPASSSNMEGLEKGQHQVWIQVGAKQIPEYPIKDCTEAYYQLRKTVGHPNIFSRWYHSTKYTVVLDMEKISGAGFTGMNTKACDLVTTNFRDCQHSDVNGSRSVPSRV